MPHKYLADWAGERRFSATGLSLARFETGNGRIPLVAVAEPETVNFSWWNPVAGRWETRSQGHWLVGYELRSIPQATQLPWSEKVGLAATPAGAFVVYKRTVPNVGNFLYIDQWIWNATTGLFTRATGSPRRIPLPQMGFVRAGVSLGAGYSPGTGKLWVLLQTVSQLPPYYRLTMLVADISTGVPDLAVRQSWQVLPISTGGFDLDVVAEDVNVYAIHRPSTYAIVGRTPARSAGIEKVPLASDIADDSRYQPLELRKIDLTNSTNAVVTAVPGGEHPQIQSLTPLRITVDRVERGEMDVVYFSLLGPRHLVSPFAIMPDIKTVGKVLLEQKTPSLWGRGRLFAFQHRILPRQLYESQLVRSNVLAELAANPARPESLIASVSTLHPFIPVFLVGEQADPQRKGTLLDFLYHRRDYGVLAVTRFFTTGAPLMTVNDEGYGVIDINHGQISPLDHHAPNPYPENDQFSPFAVGAFHILNPSPAFVAPAYDGVDNTIGGILTVERSRPGMSFFAYSDLGDDGPRVIFDEAMPPPAPVDPAGLKEFNPVAVTGPQTGSDQWLTVTVDGWEPSSLRYHARDFYSLPFRESSTTVSGLAPLLNAVAQLAHGEMLPAGTPVVIDEDEAADVQERFEELSTVAAAFENFAAVEVAAEGDADPRARFFYSPTAVFVGTTVTFDAVRSLSNPTDPAVFRWRVAENVESLADASPFEATVPTFAQTFTAAGAKVVELEAVYPDGRRSTVHTWVSISPSIWTALWEFHSQVNADMEVAGIEDASIELLNFDLRYGMDDDGNRESVTITAKDQFDTDIRLRKSGSGQGAIDHRLRVKFKSTEIDVFGALQAYIGINLVDVSFVYGRSFTPGVFMKDERRGDIFTGSYSRFFGDALDASGDDRPAVLSAKPASSTFVAVEDVSVNLALRTYAITAVLALLVLIGLVWLVTLILGLQAAIAAALSTFWGVLLAILLLIGLAFVIAVTVPLAITSEVEDRIRESLQADAFRQSLDGSPMIWYAGEGAAEALAQRAVSQLTALTVTPEQQREGVRYIPQLFQMVYVTDNKARILVRP